MIEKSIDIEPDAYIGIDYPEFNLSIEKSLKKENQNHTDGLSKFWAWRKPGQINSNQQ